MKGELFVVSAPSGTGKTTLVRTLFAQHPQVVANLRYSVSHTTRGPRPGEQHGRDYYFVTPDEFAAEVAADNFLEWAEVYGQLKGTSRRAVADRLTQGYDVLLDIDVQGALQVKERQPEAQLIFVLPPSYQELERRLRARCTDTPDQVERRLLIACSEVAVLPRYDYVIVNEDWVAATDALASIFLARRLLRSRAAESTAAILATFPMSSRPQLS
jgi:guanylate kinase